MRPSYARESLSVRPPWQPPPPYLHLPAEKNRKQNAFRTQESFADSSKVRKYRVRAGGRDNGNNESAFDNTLLQTYFYVREQGKARLLELL